MMVWRPLRSGSFERRCLSGRQEKLQRGATKILGHPAIADDGGPVPFLCECPDLGCREVVLLTLEEYEEVRSTPEGGVALPGHEDLAIERVTGRNDRYVSTAKVGRAGDVHAAGDPRS